MKMHVIKKVAICLIGVVSGISSSFAMLDDHFEEHNLSQNIFPLPKVDLGNLLETGDFENARSYCSQMRSSLLTFFERYQRENAFWSQMTQYLGNSVTARKVGPLLTQLQFYPDESPQEAAYRRALIGGLEKILRDEGDLDKAQLYCADVGRELYERIQQCTTAIDLFDRLNHCLENPVTRTVYGPFMDALRNQGFLFFKNQSELQIREKKEEEWRTEIDREMGGEFPRLLAQEINWAAQYTLKDLGNKAYISSVLKGCSLYDDNRIDEFFVQNVLPHWHNLVLFSEQIRPGASVLKLEDTLAAMMLYFSQLELQIFPINHESRRIAYPKALFLEALPSFFRVNIGFYEAEIFQHLTSCAWSLSSFIELSSVGKKDKTGYKTLLSQLLEAK